MRTGAQERDAMDKPQPHNFEAEIALLGAVILDNAHLETITKHVTAGMFFSTENRTIFPVIVSLRKAGVVVDELSLCDELRRQGKLDAVSGAGYVARLADGLPRILNVERYCEIVARDFRKRSLLHEAEALQSAIFAGQDDLIESHVAAIEAACRHTTKPGLRAVTIEELLSIELPKRDTILSPILLTQSMSMVWGWRGTGKTNFCLAEAIAIASGGKFLGWEAKKPRRVAYIDGELPGDFLKGTLAAQLVGADKTPAPDMVRIITPDLQDRPFPDLATRAGQALIEEHLDGVELMYLDNLSALIQSGKENEADSWLPVQQWILDLRRRGISSRVLHHGGKNGLQRGTSRREDLLDLVIQMKHPANYNPSEGLRAEIHFEKGRSLHGADVEPFEVRMQTGPNGAAVWTRKPLEDVQARQVKDLLDAGLSIREAAAELNMSKSKAHRLSQRPASHFPEGGTSGQDEKAAGQ